MDFKDLISLAKDNQSFAMKKFQRDNLDKSKSKKGGVSDSAVKAYMAKKRQVEEQKRAAEEAERRRRIQARLEASHGKKKAGKEKTSKEQKEASMEPTGQQTQSRNDLSRKSSTPLVNKPAEKTETNQKFQIPKKKVNGEAEKEIDEKDKNKKINLSTGNGLKSNSSGESGDYNFKKHKRRKESDFEWSGTSSAVTSGSSGDKKTISKFGAKKSASAPSFQELMNIAKQQKDKPVAPKKMTEEKKKILDDLEAMQKGSSSTTKLDDRSNERPNGKEERKGEKSGRLENNGRLSARDDIREELIRQNRCTVTTHTVDVRNNYDIDYKFKSSQFREKSNLDIRSGPKINGQHKMANIGSKRPKISSIDEELEQERIELERKRNLLRKKMQGGKGYHDNYSEYDGVDDMDDDLDGFIDDEEDDVDYSKHIRKLFGYDRRRYIDEDDDLRDMESNYRQISAEEARSSRIARLEDEIERRKEEMENRNAKRMKKSGR